MTDTRFFPAAVPFSLGQIADLTGATLSDPASAAAMMTGVAPLDCAAASDVSFVDTPQKLAALAASLAGACFASPALATRLAGGRPVLLCADPKAAYVRLARQMHPEPTPLAGISHSARVSPSAVIGLGVEIAEGAVIGAGSELGAGCVVGPNSVIGPGVVIGAGGRIGPLVSVNHAIIGARVVLHAGVRIGQAGFGYLPGPQGLIAIPQLGRVLIGDDVEIGANSTIDRGAGDDTVIGSGTKIDNLVQIAHNCRIGRNCIIISQVGLSGSVTVGDNVVLAGQVGVADHVTIGAGVRAAAKSGVTKNIPAGLTVGGFPAMEISVWRREAVILRTLARRRRVPGDDTAS